MDENNQFNGQQDDYQGPDQGQPQQYRYQGPDQGQAQQYGYQGQPQQYGYQNQQQYESTDQRKGFSITALVMGIVSLIGFCVGYVSIPCAILGIIFGFLGKNKGGKGMAIAGLVTSIITIALWIIVLILVFAFGFSSALVNPDLLY